MKEDLLKIKNAIGKRSLKSYTSLTLADQIFSELRELNRRVDELIESLGPKMKDSQVKLKRKREVISVLSKHKKVSSSQLSGLIGLSRTRCNEYLKELEAENIIKSISVGRKKFFKLEEGYE